jgi:exopolyphosphatase/guanosine-5'-triphosphate,3'-diphosphate pyrophosphatase
MGPARRPQSSEKTYAALDLGTNNCRLLVAQKSDDGFTVVDSFSRIVRLGQGLEASGKLSEAAMDRAVAALRVCAGKLRGWRIEKKRCIATQACRIAANGAEFLARVEKETGITLSVITPREEAELSVLGCSALIDPDADAALIVDIGGGSTELSWVNAKTREIHSWTSLPFGVVTLAERHGDSADDGAVYAGMIAAIRDQLAPFKEADALKESFAANRAHFLGTSGAVTSLAAVNLGLSRYRRSMVDGVWMSVDQVKDTARHLRLAGRKGRAENGCIGPDRADLVVPGAAILEALFAEWPANRVRVADRGLREGMLVTLMGAA